MHKKRTLHYLRKHQASYSPSSVAGDPRFSYYWLMGRYHGLLIADDIIKRRNRRHIPVFLRKI